MDVNAHSELSLRDLFVIYKRRRKIVYRVVGVVFLLAAIYCLFATRRYEATSTIQVQSKSVDNLGIQSMVNGSPEQEVDALSANINVQTQAEILQSDSLALKTIEDLHLEETEDFKHSWNPFNWLLGLLSPSGVADPAQATLENSPQRRRWVLLVFARHLTVKPVNGTSLIEVSFFSPNPQLAAAVVNKLTQALVDYSFATRTDATNKASGWLNSQLADLRQQSEKLEKQVADLESKSGIYSLGTIDPKGNEQSYSDVVDQLQQSATALTQAEQNRIMRGAIAHAAANGDADMLSDLAGGNQGGGGVNNSLVLIQSLRTQEATQEAALEQAQVKYDDSFPKLAELRGNIAGLQHSITQEIERLKGRAQADFDVATRAEAEDRSRYDKIKARADTLNNKSVDLAVSRQEADQSRKLYLDLLTKFKEAGALEGLEGSAITVVDPGRIPGKPKTPNVPLYLAAAILVGVVLGCCGALIVDTVDRRIITISEVERISDGRLLGVTPAFPQKKDASHDAGSLDALLDPRSSFVEAVRSIRTAILLRGTEPSKVILVTSSLAGEGKTTLSATLAVLLAQAGKKVLLMDTDLRDGKLHALLNLPSQKGLSDLLTSDPAEPPIRAVPAVPNLDALQAGKMTANASELLGSSAFEQWLLVWKAKYDHIVMDSTALLPVTDSLTLTPLTDVTLVVARSGFTERSELGRSFELLAHAGKTGVSAILNGLSPEAEGYSSYFGSRGPKR